MYIADVFVAEGETVPVGVAPGCCIFAVLPAGVEVVVDARALCEARCRDGYQLRMMPK